MIAIVGSGNVATNLYKALSPHKEVTLVNPHTLANLPQKAEIIILCVSDNAISEVANNIGHTEALIAHTSGSVSIQSLENVSEKIGVLYPLQTFTKEDSLNYKEIPVFIEGNSDDTVKDLKKLASVFSEDIREADSETRRQLHLASVFACNFVNALAGISKNILKESNIDFSVLLPLMKQTINKLQYLSPEKAQTGPAVRGDKNVMETHVKMLEDQPELKNIYTILSDYIINTRNKTI